MAYSDLTMRTYRSGASQAATNEQAGSSNGSFDVAGATMLQRSPTSQVSRETNIYGEPYVTVVGSNRTSAPQSSLSLSNPRGGVTFYGSPLGSSSRSSAGSSNTGTIQQSTIQYQGEAPDDAPRYQAPEEWTESRRAAEVQKSAAVGLRESKRALRESTAGLGRDPQSQLALRRALEQHGINTERTLAGARQTAKQAEAADMARRTAAAQAEYQSRVADFENEWRKYMASAVNISMSAPMTAQGTGVATNATIPSIGTGSYTPTSYTDFLNSTRYAETLPWRRV